MKLLDSHCHLDLLDNMKKIVRESIDDNFSIITMTTTPKAYKKNKEICQDSKNIKVAIGLHPQLISEREKELDLLLEYIKDARFVGEVGLDLNINYEKSINKQIRVFTKIIDACDWYGNKVVSIHSVRSVELVLEILRSNIRNNSNKFILHWFTGNRTNLQDAINLGCYFSINSKMQYTNRGKNIIRSLPADKILLETDAPFIVKINSVDDIYNELDSLVEQTAIIRGTEKDELCKKIEENSFKIIGES